MANAPVLPLLGAQGAVPIMAIAMADVIMEEDITALMDNVDAPTFEHARVFHHSVNLKADKFHQLL